MLIIGPVLDIVRFPVGDEAEMPFSSYFGYLCYYRATQLQTRRENQGQGYIQIDRSGGQCGGPILIGLFFTSIIIF